MLEVLVSILVIVIIAAIVNWVIDMLPIAAGIKQIVTVVVWIIALVMIFQEFFIG